MRTDTLHGRPAAIASWRRGVLVWLAVLALSTGCAYYNTFYNAKAAYKKAENERRNTPAGGTGSYQQCIEKCLSLLRYYPKSKYVDDALFLIGMSRFHLGEYVQARSSFEGLLERFPETEYAERAYYTMGLAALRQDDAAGSAKAFETLSQRFPDSRLNVEAVFRKAEAKLESRDFDKAREDLRAFLRDHPKSRLVGDAQLRLARTYYDEGRYREAREEYAKVLQHGVTPASQYEVELHIALSLRSQAEAVLSNPALQQYTKMHRAAGKIESLDLAPPSKNSQGSTTSDPESQEGAEPLEAAALDSAVVATPDSAVALPPLDAASATSLQQAEESLAEALRRLELLRKPAIRLGLEKNLDIDLAVSRALLGEPRQAIADLDQIARTHPRSDYSARAHFEIAEIHRRLGAYDKARTAYDTALQEKRDAPVSQTAQKRSAAITARSAAATQLERAADVVQRWRLQAAGGAVPVDSLEAHIALTAEFEGLASQLLRVAEIDLFELGQPLAALREFQQLRSDFAGSLQDARAAYGIAWIYDHELDDAARARQAYEVVVREFPATPQGIRARTLLENWTETGPRPEGSDPSSRP